MMTTAMKTHASVPVPPRLALDDEACWLALTTRDVSAEGRFVYGVLTTGVYCRPSCPSRRPLRKNVRFFAGGAEAERAGLRPCKRCRPGEASLAERQTAAVERACRLIEASDEPPDLAALAEAAGLSRFHFHRVFKAKTGVTPKAYADARRAGRARVELRERATVTEAIYGAGFGSNGRFYAASNARLGMAPGAFRTGGEGVEIRFAVGECSLGSILVAATDKGVCAIEFGDDPAALVRGLQDRFSKAQLLGADPGFEALVARVVGLVEDPARGADLPLDVQGTAFEERVWRVLREIPPGATASYLEVARRMGAPEAARAVAKACAANRVAVAIPCHRVVRADGSLSGYRWGVERKRALLLREGRA